ncbi:MAG: transglutaminase-like domain-containing protein [Planctomycetales bacterium]|nr:transglutaminase-like domain-containing protein [Planctomycetales bacterium]
MRLAASQVFAAFLGAAALAQEEAPPAPVAAVPAGWTLEGELDVPPQGLRLLEGKLGGKLARVANRTYVRHGFRAQVNEVECPSDPDADAVEKALVRAHGSPDFVARRGRTVLEFAKANLLLAKALRAAMGLGGSADATWEVEFRFACVEKLDAARANRVMNLFAALEKKKDDPRMEAEIRDLAKDFVFGKRVRLFTPREPAGRIEWALEPKPVRTTRENDTTAYEFADPPRRLGIPYVDVRGKISVSARFRPDGTREVGGRLATTPRWPADRPDVRSRVEKLLAGAAGPREKLEALHRFVFAEIAFKGETGSRNGVEATLSRRQGHCFDKSDLLVTLARAAGLPAREVAGWVPPLGAGHAWVEVFLSGNGGEGGGGWIPADGTCAWLGACEDYVPFFLSEDGDLPVLYLGLPKVLRVR